MRIINNGGSGTLFEVDGLQYRKGMYEVYYVKELEEFKVGIRNIHNQQPISSPISVSEYNVNGIVSSDLTSLVSALSTVLGFNKGGGGEFSVLEYNDDFIA